MKRWISLLAAAAVFLSAAACIPAVETPEAEGNYGLWFAVNGENGRSDFSAVGREDRSWDTEPSAEELLQALLRGPQSSGLISPLPKGVAVRSVYFDEGSKTVKVDLSEQYGDLTGFELTVADYCIVLTLCQLPGVENVMITVEGKYLSYRNRQQMRAGDVLLSGISDEPDTFLAALYFPNRRGSLSAEYRQVSRDDGSELAEIVISELLKGPSTSAQTAALPSGTQVLAIGVDDGVCQIDLTGEFLSAAPEDDAQAGLMLYALVNSLCALGGVSQVQLLVEGERVERCGGISTVGPLSANYDLAGN